MAKPEKIKPSPPKNGPMNMRMGAGNGVIMYGKRVWPKTSKASPGISRNPEKMIQSRPSAVMCRATRDGRVYPTPGPGMVVRIGGAG